MGPFTVAVVSIGCVWSLHLKVCPFPDSFDCCKGKEFHVQGASCARAFLVQADESKLDRTRTERLDTGLLAHLTQQEVI